MRQKIPQGLSFLHVAAEPRRSLAAEDSVPLQRVEKERYSTEVQYCTCHCSQAYVPVRPVPGSSTRSEARGNMTTWGLAMDATKQWRFTRLVPGVRIHVVCRFDHFSLHLRCSGSGRPSSRIQPWRQWKRCEKLKGKGIKKTKNGRTTIHEAEK